MAQNGGRGAGGQDSDAERRERLHEFLCELVKREGRMEAAVLLGVNYRTLVKAEESGEMTGRMSDALERLLLTWDGGAEDGDGDGDGDGEPEPGGDLARRVEALEAGLEELARELRSGLEAVRGAVGGTAKEDPSMAPEKLAAKAKEGKRSAPTQSPPAPPVAGLNKPRPVRLRRVDPELVTREPAGDDAEVYGDAWPLVKEWRELKDRLPVRGRSLSWLTGYERLLTLELAMLEEHGLTLPPQKQPVRDSLSRRDHTRWRWKALDRTQVSIRKRKLLRWLRRLLTLGAWWD
ncbi:MAG: hypothetical protein OXR67_16190 [Chloroflexota bacterium]|nr:hypothetical protein [Chloroflexota bacterium]